VPSLSLLRYRLCALGSSFDQDENDEIKEEKCNVPQVITLVLKKGPGEEEKNE
jgi:hypothetical protein